MSWLNYQFSKLNNNFKKIEARIVHLENENKMLVDIINKLEIKLEDMKVPHEVNELPKKDSYDSLVDDFNNAQLL